MMDITKEGILFPKWSDRIGNITAPRTPARKCQFVKCAKFLRQFYNYSLVSAQQQNILERLILPGYKFLVFIYF